MRTGRPAIEDPKAYKISTRLTASELAECTLVKLVAILH